MEINGVMNDKEEEKEVIVEEKPKTTVDILTDLLEYFETFKNNNKDLFKLKDSSVKGFETVNDCRDKLLKNLKFLKLSIEKQTMLKESLKDQQNDLNEEINSKTKTITELTMKGVFDNNLLNEIRDLSSKVKIVADKEILYQKDIEDLHSK